MCGMNFVKQHWLAFLLLAALIVSPIYSHHDAKTQARQQADVVRQANITRCIATSPRAAYDIAFQYQASSTRKAAGNIVPANKYAALADAGIATVAAPRGHLADPKLVEVVYVKTADPKHPLSAQLTPEALYLQKAGCEEAYTTS